ncbi:MAG: phosphatidylethanolamine N-methyltransferase [Candidatus Thiodiazotropha sp.]
MYTPFRIEPKFLFAWLRNPRQIGAIWPSGSELTHAMAAQIQHLPGVIVELGAGTGAVTSALLSRGVSDQQLVVVEKDPLLAAELSRRFPGLRIVLGDAARLSKLLGEIRVGPVDQIVSSLPLLSLRRQTRLRILSQIVRNLTPRGRLIQFSYSPKSPISAGLSESLQMEGSIRQRVLWNFPPARVWVYTRRDEPGTACRISGSMLGPDNRP